MRVIRLLCLASLLALILLSGTAESGALADVRAGEGPSVTTQAEECARDENRQGSAEIRITMTGICEDSEADARHDSAGVLITMTSEEEDSARASVTLVARTGSPDGG